MLQMASGKGFSGQAPADVDLDNKDIANTTCQTTRMAEIFDATDVVQAEIKYGSLVSSSEEVVEEPSEDHIEELADQALVTKEEWAAACKDDGNSRNGDVQEKCSDKTIRSCSTTNTHYRWQVSLLLINNEYYLDSEITSDDANASLLVAMELDSTRENWVLRKLLRAPRYFDYPESNCSACSEFSEDDDRSNKARANKWHKSCYICGDNNHSGNRCKKVNACAICSGKGHQTINCPNKNVEPACASTTCLKCGNTDHDMFSCTGDYDPEDLKAMECYICKEAGHLCCAEIKGEGANQASCYRCGQSGHFGLECTESNEVSFDPCLLCRICNERGHSRKQCPKKAKAKLKRKKYWIARARKYSNQTLSLGAPNAASAPPSASQLSSSSVLE